LRSFKAEGQQHREARHGGQLGLEEAPAGLDLLGEGLVFGRHAANGIGDSAIDQLHAVVGAPSVGPAREAELGQRGVEQIAGVVAGEGAPGAVRALQAGSQADDQETRVQVPERRHGPVVEVGQAAPVYSAKGSQPRAGLTVGFRYGRTFPVHCGGSCRRPRVQADSAS
jgi:hypothetical protein